MALRITDRTLARVSLGFIAISIVLGVSVVAWDRLSRFMATPEVKRSVVRQVTDAEHIIGPVDASVTLIVYTDLECKYCKRFHFVTMPALRERYGESIAIVYRHFPLPSRPKGRPEAEAAECAAQLGGETAFWEFMSKVFSITPSDNGLKISRLPEIAASIGLNEEAFIACQKSSAAKERVQRDIIEGTIAGIMQTPSILVRSSDRSLIVAGDYPLRIRTAIEYVSNGALMQ